MTDFIKNNDFLFYINNEERNILNKIIKKGKIYFQEMNEREILVSENLYKRNILKKFKSKSKGYLYRINSNQNKKI